MASVSRLADTSDAYPSHTICVSPEVLGMDVCAARLGLAPCTPKGSP